MLPKIRRRPWPWAPWGEWHSPSSIEEFDDVMMEEYRWGSERCAEHQQEKEIKRNEN